MHVPHSCQTCQFFYTGKALPTFIQLKHEGRDVRFGICRRRAPSPEYATTPATGPGYTPEIEFTARAVVPNVPIVPADWWCGEYECFDPCPGDASKESP